MRFKKISFLLVFLFLVFPIFIFSQIKIQGIVVDKKGNPLEKMTISLLKEPKKQVWTNKEGAFVLETSLPEEEIILIIKGKEGVGQVKYTPSSSLQKITYPVSTIITVFHNNDIHGALENFSKVAFLVKQEKQKNPDVFLFCAGDIFSGNPLVDQYQPKGKPIIELMNSVGYHAMALGNHEFDYGQSILSDRIKEANFPILSANIITKNTPLENLIRSFLILETHNKLPIAILSLLEIDSNGIPSTHPDRVKGIRFLPPEETLKRFLFLRQKPIFIGLTHLGFELDKKLASRYKVFDAIIGGHSHTLVKEPFFISNTLIAQAGDKNKYLGKITFYLENEKIVEKKYEIIDLENFIHKDENIEKKIQAILEQNPLKKEIAVLPFSLKGKNNLAQWMSDAIRHIHRLDITFHNTDGVRHDTLSQKVTLEEVYRIDPFENQIAVIEMSLEEIKSLIAFSYNKKKNILLEPSGIHYKIIIDNQKNIREILLFTPDRKPLPNQKYKVGINGYIASAYNYQGKEKQKLLPYTTAETFIAYLSNKFFPEKWQEEKRATIEE